MFDRKLPKGKWYTYALDQVKGLAEHRNNLNFRDSYEFRRIIDSLGGEIRNWLPIFADKENIAPEDRPLVAEGLRLLLEQGRLWEEKDVEQITIAMDLIKDN